MIDTQPHINAQRFPAASANSSYHKSSLSLTSPLFHALPHLQEQVENLTPSLFPISLHNFAENEGRTGRLKLRQSGAGDFKLFRDSSFDAKRKKRRHLFSSSFSALSFSQFFFRAHNFVKESEILGSTRM